MATNLERNPKGRSAKLYWSKSGQMIGGDDGQGGTHTVASWLAHDDTVIAGDMYDVTPATTPEYADITTRKNAAGGFTARKPVIRDAEATYDVIWNTNDTDDTFVQKLIDNTNSSTPMSLAFMDYAIDDPDATAGDVIQGLAGNFYVSFSKTEAIRDVQKATITHVPESETTWHKHTIGP